MCCHPLGSIREVCDVCAHFHESIPIAISYVVCYIDYLFYDGGKLLMKGVMTSSSHGRSAKCFSYLFLEV